MIKELTHNWKERKIKTYLFVRNHDVLFLLYVSSRKLDFVSIYIEEDEGDEIRDLYLTKKKLVRGEKSQIRLRFLTINRLMRLLMGPAD